MARCLIALSLVALLAGCSSFNLGAMLYVPHGQAAVLHVGPPTQAEPEKK